MKLPQYASNGKAWRKSIRKQVVFDDSESNDEYHSSETVEIVDDNKENCIRRTTRKRKAPSRFVDLSSSGESSSGNYSDEGSNCAICKMKRAEEN